eukprot:scaffold1503_cov250-Pinguiococcus_pyrenoidosus.AAC.15
MEFTALTSAPLLTSSLISPRFKPSRASTSAPCRRSTFPTSASPRSTALPSSDWPEKYLALRSAPAAHINRTSSASCSFTTYARSVSLGRVAVKTLTSAPASRSTPTTDDHDRDGRWQLRMASTAATSGVLPWLLALTLSAPASNSAARMSARCLSAAMCTALRPS